MAALLVTGLAFIAVRSFQSLTLTKFADDTLLKGFELFLALLLFGTASLVALGLVLRAVLPETFGTRPFAENRLREIYTKEELGHISIESERDHSVNPYRDLPDLELCDVALQVDQEKYPEVWLDVAPRNQKPRRSDRTDADWLSGRLNKFPGEEPGVAHEDGGLESIRELPEPLRVDLVFARFWHLQSKKDDVGVLTEDMHEVADRGGRRSHGRRSVSARMRVSSTS